MKNSDTWFSMKDAKEGGRSINLRSVQEIVLRTFALLFNNPGGTFKCLMLVYAVGKVKVNREN